MDCGGPFQDDVWWMPKKWKDKNPSSFFQSSRFSIKQKIKRNWRDFRVIPFLASTIHFYFESSIIRFS